MTVNHGVVGSSPTGGAKKKASRKTCFFSIQSEGLACNLTAGEYVIAEGVWHHALACILLRIDYIQHFVLISYRKQVADFIHGFAVILRVAFLYYELNKWPRQSAWFFCWLFLFNLIQRFRRVADRRAKRALTATFDVFAREMRSSRPQGKLANLERGTSDKFVIKGVVGSSKAGGARKKTVTKVTVFFHPIRRIGM